MLRAADVVISTDASTDRALGLVPDLTGNSAIVHSRDCVQVFSALASLADVLAILDAERSDRIVNGRIIRRELDAKVVSELHKMLDPALCAQVPDRLLPVQRTAETIRSLRTVIGNLQGASIALAILSAFQWESAPGFEHSALMAQQVIAQLWCYQDQAHFPVAKDVTAAAAYALEGADIAFNAGHLDLARGRLTDALTLMFHRERHMDASHSAMVADPASFFRGLYANRTFNALLQRDCRRAAPRRISAPEERPRVLFLSGAYGDYHEPVVAALAEVATVTLHRPRRLHRFFHRKVIDPQVIDALGDMHGLGPSPDTDDWQVRDLTPELRRRLRSRLRSADVIFADWADRLTVWASHLLPQGRRMVVRIHSLDALHPWFHLMDWTAVDEVIVVSEPLRRLVQGMLDVAEVDIPVRIIGNIAALHQMSQPKHQGARTTLGMVGWGRRVKDPLWALELLAREPSWRLVLIGPEQAGYSASDKEYHARIHRRLQDPQIRGRVEIVGQTDDVAGHLRHVGVILSTSARESWHLGLVEGAASGAVPVVRNWPLFAPLGGAYSLFPADWIVESVDEAEARIREVTEPARWESERRRAQQEALSLFDPARLAQDYREAILGPLVTG